MALTDLEIVKEIAASAGMPADLFILIVLLFLPLFLAPIYLRLGNSTLRAYFDVVVGSAFLLGLYGFQASIHFYALATLSYVLILVLGPNSPVPITVIAFVYLSARHIIRYLYPGESYDVDITGPMMMLVLNVVSMAYEYKDKVAQGKTPSLLLTAGYVCHHSTLICGPPLMFDEYILYTAVNQKDIPNPTLPALTKLAAGLFWFALHIKFVLLSDDTASKLADPVFAFSMPFYARLLYAYVHVAKLRMKFYAAWLTTEASLTLSGWGYDNEKKEWNKMTNVRPITVEFGENTRSLINNWNIRVSEWLRRYVMEKFSDKEFGTIAAFIVSGFWHGFSITQITFFFFAGLHLLVISRNARKAFRPIALEFAGGALKPVYDVVGAAVNAFIFGFIGFAWANETVEGMLACWANLYYIGFVLDIICYVASVIVLSRQRKSSSSTEKTPSKRTSGGSKKKD
eukprot:c13113_g1_i1.p1 GENE.c13113_g1_i1~~c13113_g1_i1.p1  ORF type:complete len:465 (-),score=169.47 c13113_g1_i1:799-2169(-)